MGAISKGFLYASIFLSGYVSGCLSCAKVESSYTFFSRNKDATKYSQEKISDMENRLNHLEKRLEDENDRK